MSSELGIEVVRAGADLRIVGRLDARTAPVVRTALQAVIDDGVGDIRVRMRDLEIWDAGGLGVLVGAQRRARQCGRRLLLLEVSPRQMRLLRAIRLHRLLGAQVDTTRVTAGSRPRASRASAVRGV